MCESSIISQIHNFPVARYGNRNNLVVPFKGYARPTAPAKLAAPAKPGRVLPEKKFRMSLRPATQNPYPIYNQHLRLCLPYLFPYQNFDVLIKTLCLSIMMKYEASYFFIDNDEKKILLKKWYVPISRLQTKMAAKRYTSYDHLKTIPFGACIVRIGVYPSPRLRCET